MFDQFQWYQLAYATEIKSIQLHDSIVRLSQKIVSFTLHYITFDELLVSDYNDCLCLQLLEMDCMMGTSCLGVRYELHDGSFLFSLPLEINPCLEALVTVGCLNRGTWPV